MAIKIITNITYKMETTHTNKIDIQRKKLYIYILARMRCIHTRTRDYLPTYLLTHGSTGNSLHVK